MPDATRRKRKIAVWLVVGSVVAVSASLAAFEHIWSYIHSLDNPLGSAITAYQRRDWGEAARLARVRLKTKRDDADASRLLARAWLRLDNEGRALEIYKALGDEALAAEDFYLLGLQQERRGNLAGAVESWQLGVQKDPGHGEMLASLAWAMARLDRFSGATFVVQQLLLQPGWKERADLLVGDIYRHDERPGTSSRRPGPRARLDGPVNRARRDQSQPPAAGPVFAPDW